MSSANETCNYDSPAVTNPALAAGTKLNAASTLQVGLLFQRPFDLLRFTIPVARRPDLGRDMIMGDIKAFHESPDPISTYHDRCVQSFTSLIISAVNPVRDFGDQVSPNWLSNEFDRYKVWAGNVGARHRGPRYYVSLDYRLSEASFYRQQVCRLCPRPVTTMPVSCG